MLNELHTSSDSRHRKRILIVDDSPEEIIVTSYYLSHNALYTIDTASNGLEALEKLSKNKSDIILMDWEMPGMSGLETIAKIRENDVFTNIPIILLTGRRTQSEDLADALESGAVDYLRKPVQPIELNARMKSALKLAEYQAQIVEQQRLMYQQEILFKQNEILEKSIQMARISVFLNDIFKKLSELSIIPEAEFKKQLNHMLNSFQLKSKAELWNEFELNFDKVHNDFYKRIHEKFPEITPNERRLCALLKLNLASKEIASITQQNVNAIDVARYRLRQKLGLNKDENLVDFLLKL